LIFFFFGGVVKGNTYTSRLCYVIFLVYGSRQEI
jgi:hypothetical protein